MESASIVVAYHASAPHPTGDAVYRAICNVRPDGSKPDGFETFDDRHGLPDRNLAYCELSAMRAGLAVSGDEWFGLTHYRRLFTADPEVGEPDRYPAFRRLKAFDWQTLGTAGATWPDIRGRLADNGFGTAPGLDVRRLGYANLLDQYVDAHPIQQIEVASATLQRSAPAGTTFIEYLRTAKRLRPFNMLLARREHVDRYVALLWPVLEDAWQRLPHPEGTYARRWPGFLAERILNYWLDVLEAESPIVRHELPLMLLHEATVSNGAAPEQGRIAGAARPRSRVLASAALARLAPPLVRPLAVFERARARAATV